MSLTDFGFKKVQTQEKQTLVQDVFSSVASKYDVMNDMMSFGLHRIWKRSLIDQIRPKPNQKFLDVAGGTGDISFKIYNETDKQADITVCDLNQNMLDEGKRRAEEKGYDTLKWQHGNAQELPFEDNSFDVYTISFGLRNVTDIDLALREAHRVLKPGGRYFCLEFSKVTNEVLAQIYDVYSFQMIPFMGEKITGDREAYQYLVESIRKFPKQKELAEKLRNAGFDYVKYRNMTAGAVAVHSGVKL